MSIAEIVSNVIYINLDSRTDRKELIESELSKIFPKEKLHRLSAIRHTTNGSIGCTMSHVAALEKAIKENWTNVLIVEDDLEFTASLEEINEGFCKHYMHSHDVILLAGSKPNCTHDGRLRHAHSTLSYFIESHYYLKLLANMKEGLELFVNTGETWNYAGDVYWNKLIKTDSWYILNPMACKQRADYSDIEKQIMNYDALFKITIVDSD
jgi:GR25 family glycosyltransferase involved in LPS biosynthesis